MGVDLGHREDLIEWAAIAELRVYAARERLPVLIVVMLTSSEARH
jgi:hypothetical protein